MAFGVNDPNGGGAGQRFIESSIRHVSGDFDMTNKLDKKVVKSWAQTFQVGLKLTKKTCLSQHPTQIA